jgi:hypothetical protein
MQTGGGSISEEQQEKPVRESTMEEGDEVSVHTPVRVAP